MKEDNSREPIIIKSIGPIYPDNGGLFTPEPKPPYPPLEPGPVIPNYPLVKIKSVSQDAFIILGYENVLYAVGYSLNQGAIFKVIPINSYQVKIQTVDGRFVRINRDDMLIANGNYNNASVFNLFKTEQMEFSLMALNGNYVRVRENDGALLVGAEFAGPNTRFKFRKIN